MLKIERKIITIVLLFIIVYSNCVFADDNQEIEDTQVLKDIDVMHTYADLTKEPTLNARAAVVYDRKSKDVIFEKNADERRPMASTTKIMTAIVVLENDNLSDFVEVSKKAAGTGGSRLGLEYGDKITIKDLLYGLLLVSGNDAAVALAEYTAGDIEKFAVLMNKKAEDMSLINTHFITPHGLDYKEHYTTAYELAKITDYALENSLFSQIVSTKNYTVTINNNPKSLNNTNELLGNLNGVNGVKTGFTNGANRCLVTSVNRNDMQIITVVLGADTKKFRTTDSVKLIEYAYSNFKVININELIKEKFQNWKEVYEKNITINKGIYNNVDTKIEEISKECLSIKQDMENNIQIYIDATQYIESPVEENFEIGKIRLFVGNEERLCISILNSKNIDRKRFVDYFLEVLLQNFNNCKNNIGIYN